MRQKSTIATLWAILFFAGFCEAVPIATLDSLLENRIAKEYETLLSTLNNQPTSRIGDRLSIGSVTGVGVSNDPSINRENDGYVSETMRVNYRLFPKNKGSSRGKDSIDLLIQKEKNRENLLLLLYQQSIFFQTNSNRIALLDSSLETEQQWLRLVAIREREGFTLSRDQEEFTAGFLMIHRNRAYAINARQEAIDKISLLTGVTLGSADSIDLSELKQHRSKLFVLDSLAFKAEPHRLSQYDRLSPWGVSVGSGVSATHWFESDKPGFNAIATVDISFYPGMFKEQKKREHDYLFARDRILLEEKIFKDDQRIITTEIAREIADRTAAVAFASTYADQNQRSYALAKKRAVSILGDQNEKELVARLAYFRARLEEIATIEQLALAHAKAAIYAPQLLAENPPVAKRMVLVWNKKELNDSLTVQALKTYSLRSIALSFTSDEIRNMQTSTATNSVVKLLDSLHHEGIAVSLLIGDPGFLTDTTALKTLIFSLRSLPHSSIILDLEPSQLSTKIGDRESQLLLLNSLRAAKSVSQTPIIPLIHSSLVTRPFAQEITATGVSEIGAMIYRSSESAIVEESTRLLNEVGSLGLSIVISAEPADVIGTTSALRDGGSSMILSTITALEQIVHPSFKGTIIQSLHHLSEVKK